MEYSDFEKEAEAANGLKIMVLWSSPLVSYDCGVIFLDWPLWNYLRSKVMLYIGVDWTYQNKVVVGRSKADLATIRKWLTSQIKFAPWGKYMTHDPT